MKFKSDLELTEESIFQIKNLKFHRTTQKSLKSIFEFGLLSPTEQTKKKLEYKKNYGPVAQKKHGMQYISVWDIDGNKTEREQTLERELQEHNVKYPRKLPCGEDRRKTIFSFFGSQSDICLIIHPNVETNPQGEEEYEHMVKDEIAPEKIIGVCYDKNYDFIDNTMYETETDGKRKKQQFLETCKKYKKPVFEFDYDTKTIKKIE